MNRLLLILILFLWVSCVPVFEAVTFRGENVTFTSFSDSLHDPEFQKQLDPYRIQMDKELSDTLAFSSLPLVSFRPESPLSNLISDMLLEWGQKRFSDWVPGSSLSFSVMNHGGIRSALPEGAITVGDLFSLLPFENEMVVLCLTGSQVAELADHLASRGGEGVSGISFGIQSRKAMNIQIRRKELDPDEKYWLVTNDYLANGGDGMKTLTRAEKRIPLGIKLRDAIIGLLRENTRNGVTIHASSDGRVYHVD